MSLGVVWACRVTAVALALLVLPHVFSSWLMTVAVVLFSLLTVLAPDELVTAATSMLGFKPPTDRVKAGGPR